MPVDTLHNGRKLNNTKLLSFSIGHQDVVLCQTEQPE